MRFDYDIFISYAHVDNQVLIPGERPWVDEFHRVLDLRLKQLGMVPVIWRDLKLTGNDVFDNEITDRISKVGLLVSIFSPRYINSEWCNREINEFAKICESNLGLTINNKSRVFKVIKTPVSLDLHPPFVKRNLGYEFYGTDVYSGKFTEYSTYNNPDNLYISRMDDLANDLARLLNELRQAEATAGPKEEKSDNGKKVKSIFLSESSFDQKNDRDMLKRELQDYGYNIVPSVALPLVEPELKKDVDEALTGSQVSIHLLGNNYGVVPEGSERSIVELQMEIGAQKAAQKNMQRLIWMPERLEPADERQRNLVQKLISGTGTITNGAEVIRGSIEDFKSVVRDTLDRLERKAPENKPPAAGPTGKTMYIIHDREDEDDVVPLINFIADSGIEPIPSLFDGDETELREYHIDNMKSCNGVLIYFGKGSEIWLRTKMKDLMKVNGYGRTSPLAVKCIFVGAPVSPAKQRFRTLEAVVIDGTEQLPVKDLQEQFSKL